MRGILLIGVAVVSLLAPSAAASDATLKATFLRGVTQIRTSAGAVRLHDQLVVTKAKLTADQASSARGRQGRALAIEGFSWRIRAAAQVELGAKLAAEQKFGQALAAATKANRFQKTGRALLVAAGKAFGVPVSFGKKP